MSASLNNVLLINALVGLCKPDLKWPRDLYLLGYSTVCLELEVETRKGKKVKPDLVLASTKQAYCLVIESKTGTIDSSSSQLKNYQSLTIADVTTKLLATGVKNFCVAMVCLEGNEKTVVRSIVNQKHNFPVIAVKTKSIKLVKNEISDSDTEKPLKKGIKISLDKAPQGYMNFDHESSFDEIAPHLLQELITAAASNSTPIANTELTRRAFGDLWSIYLDGKQQGKMRKQVCRLLLEAETKELKGYLEHTERGGEYYWSVHYGKAAGKYPAAQLKGLKTKSKNLLNRLRKEVTQPALFEIY